MRADFNLWDAKSMAERNFDGIADTHCKVEACKGDWSAVVPPEHAAHVFSLEVRDHHYNGSMIYGTEVQMRHLLDMLFATFMDALPDERRKPYILEMLDVALGAIPLPSDHAEVQVLRAVVNVIRNKWGDELELRDEMQKQIVRIYGKNDGENHVPDSGYGAEPCKACAGEKVHAETVIEHGGEKLSICTLHEDCVSQARAAYGQEAVNAAYDAAGPF